MQRRRSVVSYPVDVMTSTRAGRVSDSSGRAGLAWLVGGAISMGFGIWSMHFIGMLAFSLPIPMAYDTPLTLLSLLIGMVVSGIALFVVRSPSMTTRNLSTGAMLMGVGIASMHYTGMYAMRMSPPIQYDPLLFVASVLIAIGASLAALWIAFQLRRRHSVQAVFAKLGSAMIMGLAIVGIGIGIGLVGYAALSGIARQPEQAGAIQGAMFILAGLVEGAGIIALVLCLLLPLIV